MKVCPRCNESYSDPSLNFCLNDGTPLTPGGGDLNSEQTVVMDAALPTQFAAPPPVTNLQNYSGLTAGNPAPAKKSRSTLLIVLGLLATVIVLCGGGFLALVTMNLDFSSNRTATTGTSTPTPRSSPSLASTPSITLPSSKGEYEVTIEKFDRIKNGMKRADVEAIFGGKGTEYYNGKGGGVSFISVKYVGDNFKTIFVSYRDDKVTSKTQVGLN